MPTVKVTREDWLRAALAAIAESGIGAVAVDPLARRLGVSRGSFYWHFADRAALVTDALGLWEQLATTDFIDRLSEISAPRERLRALLLGALIDDEISGLEPAIVAHAADPAVRPVLDRVNRRRLDYLTALYAESGLSPKLARRQAVAAYAAYLGWIELRRASPDVAPETAAGARGAGAAALEHLLGLLMPEADAVGGKR